MNLRAAYGYQMNDHKKALLIFYSIIVVVYLILSVVLSLVFMHSGGTEGSMSGSEMSSFIFLFVSGLVAFKESFGMLMQNGISRKSMVVSKILIFITLALAVSVFDHLFYVFLRFFTQLVGVNASIVLLADAGIYQIPQNPVWRFLDSFVFNAAAGLCVLGIGYMISILFYRLGKLGKVVVGAGVPVLFVIVLPLLDVFLTKGVIMESILKFLLQVMGITSGISIYAIITFLVVFCICMAASWFMVRRCALRE